MSEIVNPSENGGANPNNPPVDPTNGAENKTPSVEKCWVTTLGEHIDARRAEKKAKKEAKKAQKKDKKDHPKAKKVAKKAAIGLGGISTLAALGKIAYDVYKSKNSSAEMPACTEPAEIFVDNNDGNGFQPVESYVPDLETIINEVHEN